MNEQQVRNALDFLKGNGIDWDNAAAEDAPGVYSIKRYGPLSRTIRREEYSTIVDFGKRVITVYGWSVSGHNGDHYSEVHELLSWSLLPEIGEYLRHAVATKLKKDELRRQQELLQKAENESVDAILNRKL